MSLRQFSKQKSVRQIDNTPKNPLFFKKRVCIRYVNNPK